MEAKKINDPYKHAYLVPFCWSSHICYVNKLHMYIHAINSNVHNYICTYVVTYICMHVIIV